VNDPQSPQDEPRDPFGGDLDGSAAPEADSGNQPPGASDTPPVGGETGAEAAPQPVTREEYEELRSKLEAAERRAETAALESQRLAGELAVRYEPRPAPAAAATPENPALRGLAERLGVEEGDLRAAFDAHVAPLREQVAGEAVTRVLLLQNAEKKTAEFYARFPRLAKHKDFVNSVTRQMLTDTVARRGRELFEPSFLEDIAKRCHQELKLELEDANAPSVATAGGDVEEAHVAPARPRPPAPRPAEPEEPDGVSDFIGSMAKQRESGMAGSTVARLPNQGR
jgi:hypothetical protein